MSIPNETTPEGRALGAEMARLCDTAIDGEDNRCATCAFRKGDHLANGSPATLMNALKCVIEGDPFYCHEHERPCAGWVAMSGRKDRGVPRPKLEAPWPFIEGQIGRAHV